jgi:two-component system chemotaxis sensor kinase CheA
MLTISARQSGNTIHIGIMDDGRGIDVDALAAKAIASGLHTAEQIAAMSREEKIELIYEAGLSTAEKRHVDLGRGVGMDVVRANIEKFGGTLEIESLPGEGTRFLICVPLTLSILPSLTVEAGGQTFAIPRSYVEEIVSTAGGQLEFAQVGERRFVTSATGASPASRSATRSASRRGDASLFVILRLGWGDLYAMASTGSSITTSWSSSRSSPGSCRAGCSSAAPSSTTARRCWCSTSPRSATARASRASCTARRRSPRTPRREPSAKALRVILFRALDGERRAIAMSAVEQVERADARRSARPGSTRRSCSARDPAACGRSADASCPQRITVLRLGDRGQRIAYARARCSISPRSPACSSGSTARPRSSASRWSTARPPSWSIATRCSRATRRSPWATAR